MFEEQSTEAGHPITIIGRNVAVTDAMKQYCHDKIAKIERLGEGDRIVEITATLDIQKLEHRADFHLQIGHTFIVAHGVTQDMYSAIDQAADRLRRKLRRYRTRIRSHHATGVGSVDLEVNVIRPALEEEVDAEIEEINNEIEAQNWADLQSLLGPHKIVKRKQVSLKQLTYDEAVVKMDLTGNAFMIFRCEEDQELKVIYRRNDDNYGIIDLPPQ